MSEVKGIKRASCYISTPSSTVYIRYESRVILSQVVNSRLACGRLVQLFWDDTEQNRAGAEEVFLNLLSDSYRGGGGGGGGGGGWTISTDAISGEWLL